MDSCVLPDHQTNDSPNSDSKTRSPNSPDWTFDSGTGLSCLSDLSGAETRDRYCRGPGDTQNFSSGDTNEFLLRDCSSSPSSSSSHSPPTLMENTHLDPTTDPLEDTLLLDKCRTQGNVAVSDHPDIMEKLLDERDTLLLGHIGDVISYYQSQLRSGILMSDMNRLTTKTEGIHDPVDSENTNPKDLYQYSNGKDESCCDDKFLMNDSLSSSSGSRSSSTYSRDKPAGNSDLIKLITSKDVSKSNEPENLVADNDTQFMKNTPSSDKISVPGNSVSVVPRESKNLDEQPIILEEMKKEVRTSIRTEQSWGKACPPVHENSVSVALRKSENLDEQPIILEEMKKEAPSIRARQLWGKARPPALALKLENASVAKDISPNSKKISGFKAMMNQLQEQQEGTNNNCTVAIVDMNINTNININININIDINININILTDINIHSDSLSKFEFFRDSVLIVFS